MIKFLKKIIGIDTITVSPEYHNYTKQAKCWGHSMSCIDAKNGDNCLLHVLGHSKGLIKKGDYIVLGELFGAGYRYQVDSVKYFDNPKDMFEADLSFAKVKNDADGERYDQVTCDWEEKYKQGETIYTSRSGDDQAEYRYEKHTYGYRIRKIKVHQKKL